MPSANMHDAQSTPLQTSSMETKPPRQPGNGHLHAFSEGIETVISAAPSPDASCLPNPLDRRTSNSSVGFPSRTSQSPQAPTPHMLRQNPMRMVGKNYMQLLRKHQMAHCDKNQVLYRLDGMSQETVCAFSKSMVEILEEFLEAFDEATSTHQSGQRIVGNNGNNTDSAHNAPPPMVNEGCGGQNTLTTMPLSGEHSDDCLSLLSGVMHNTTGMPNWRQNQLLTSDQPFTSFASYMTTASMRSMDERQQIQETNLLKKSQDDDGNKTINGYSVLADLGKGAFGKVKLGVNNETNETVAIKIIKKSILKKSSDPMALNREIAILKKVRHQNVVSLYEVIDDPDSDKLYLVMQYVCNGPIVRIKSDFTCSPIPEETCKQYLKQLLSGVRYLHKRHIVHHDIKPDNILLGSDGMVYITDFGVSEVFSAEQSLNESTRRGVGTPMFSAPELLAAQTVAEQSPMESVEAVSDTDSQASHRKPRERSNSGSFDGVASDTWSLGVTAFLLLVGRVPFTGHTFLEVVRAIETQPMDWSGFNTQGQVLNPLWKEVLDGMLEKDPKNRWTLKRVKNHAIFHEAEPSVIGAMKRQASKAIMVTASELSNATRKVSNFLHDTRSFSKNASNVAHTYVAKLRKRVSQSHPTSLEQKSLEEPEVVSGSFLDEEEQEVNPPMQKQGTVVFSASPPKVSCAEPSPRNSHSNKSVPIGNTTMVEASPPTACVQIDAEAPMPRFDDVFSVRRPTVAGPAGVRRPSVAIDDDDGIMEEGS